MLIITWFFSRSTLIQWRRCRWSHFNAFKFQTKEKVNHSEPITASSWPPDFWFNQGHHKARTWLQNKHKAWYNWAVPKQRAKELQKYKRTEILPSASTLFLCYSSKLENQPLCHEERAKWKQTSVIHALFSFWLQLTQPDPTCTLWHNWPCSCGFWNMVHRFVYRFISLVTSSLFDHNSRSAT